MDFLQSEVNLFVAFIDSIGHLFRRVVVVHFMILLPACFELVELFAVTAGEETLLTAMR